MSAPAILRPPPFPNVAEARLINGAHAVLASYLAASLASSAEPPASAAAAAGGVTGYVRGTAVRVDVLRSRFPFLNFGVLFTEIRRRRRRRKAASPDADAPPDADAEGREGGEGGAEEEEGEGGTCGGGSEEEEEAEGRGEMGGDEDDDEGGDEEDLEAGRPRTLAAEESRKGAAETEVPRSRKKRKKWAPWVWDDGDGEGSEQRRAPAETEDDSPRESVPASSSSKQEGRKRKRSTALSPGQEGEVAGGAPRRTPSKGSRSASNGGSQSASPSPSPSSPSNGETTRKPRPSAQVAKKEADEATTRRGEFDGKIADLAALERRNGRGRVPVVAGGGARDDELGRRVRGARRERRKARDGGGPSDLLGAEESAELAGAGFESEPVPWPGGGRRKRSKMAEKDGAGAGAVDLGGDFDERMADLAAFKERAGHCRVPILENRARTELGRWVQRVRREYRKALIGAPSELTVERLARLAGAGFEFESYKVTTGHGATVPWEERMEMCRAFKEEHGHLKIAPSYPKLGSWAANVKRLYHEKREGRKTKLTPERVAQLEGMGFDWTLVRREKPKSWEERFEEFLEFKREHGHPYVPQHLPGGLGRWVNNQRWKLPNLKSAGKGGKEVDVLSTERIKKLNEAGFAWNAKFMSGPKRQKFEEAEGKCRGNDEPDA